MFAINVNGDEHELDVPGEMPLLWVLRDHLGLTGTKFGCGIGQCAACAVHLDGASVPSCVLPMAQAAGRRVVTIEGLARDQSHPVLRAWIAEQVPQCGYCQSGQVMAAAALLVVHPTPSDAEIDEAMRPNLCRCGTYPRIRRAIHRAAGG